MELKCVDCPRDCRADRTRRAGYCRAGAAAEIAAVNGQPYMIHRFEEPIISGVRGTAAVFFRGCNLGCVYCQNRDISGPGEGTVYSVNELADMFLRAAESGAHSLSLITAAHYIRPVVAALEKIKARLPVPVVYNSSGYEKAEAIRRLDGLTDVYLPDFKYMDSARAARYSAAPDYGTVAVNAIAEMARQSPTPVIRDGVLQKGVLIRHLVLPGGRADGAAIMRTIAEKFPTALVSIMRQYTPAFCREGYPELNRRVTSYEYESVVRAASDCGLQGFTQGRESADTKFTPRFD